LKSPFATRAIGRAGASIPAELSFDGISRAFGERRALSNISFSIAPAEVVCLLGASGCGKTTLLRIAAGIDRPSAGRVLVDGQVIEAADLHVPPEHRSIGLVFQDYALFPHMTILENVMFGLNRLPKAEARSVGMQGLERLGLSDLAHMPPEKLSGGEQQRVALARAIAPRPRMLLMDEPFSNLDRRMRDVVRDETVALLRETGVTTMIVTHDPEEAMRVADRIVLLSKGEIMAIGKAEELYRRPQSIFTARFFTELNEISGRVQAGRVETPVGTFAAPGLPDGAAVTVCIRPQGLRMRASGVGIPARIVSRRFVGEVELLEFHVQGLDRPLKGRIRDGVNAKRASDIGLEIDPNEVLVFAADGQ
jgi:iron(III) transport system ATP-binding protein